MNQDLLLKDRCEQPRFMILKKAVRTSGVALGVMLLLGTPMVQARNVYETSHAVVMQQTAINGVVTDEQGRPLVGASVRLVGSGNVGTTTNDLGAFTLSVPDLQATVSVSYVGYVTQQYKLSGQSTVKITMEMEAAGIDEVVVVGYGTQRRSEVTGSTSNVKGDAITELPTQSFDAALSGR